MEAFHFGEGATCGAHYLLAFKLRGLLFRCQGVLYLPIICYTVGTLVWRAAKNIRPNLCLNLKVAVKSSWCFYSPWPDFLCFPILTWPAAPVFSWMTLYKVFSVSCGLCFQ